jgi:hypothetical protein
MYQSPQFQRFIQERGPIVQEIEKKKKENIEGLISVLDQGIHDGSIDPSIDKYKTAHITMITTAMFVVAPNKHGNTDECPTSSEELLNYYFELLARSIQTKK